MSHLLAGVSRIDVTPPVGIMLAGTLRESPSRRVDRPLTATALALDDTGSAAIIVACDAIRLDVDMANEIRDTIADDLQLSRSQILLNVSHTHAAPDAPPFADFLHEGGNEQARLHGAYWATFRDRVRAAANSAYAQMVPARLGVQTGSVSIGVNRREVKDDGTLVLGENPEGVTDDTVGIVRIDDLAGKPIAMVVHYACHPDILGPKSDLISPDFVGAARDLAEAVTGATALFLQGCAGDIDPCSGIVVGDDAITEVRRLGGMLGCEAARIYLSVDVMKRRSHRIEWQSAASVVTAWKHEPIPAMPTAVAVRSCVTALPLTEPPTRETAAADARAARDAETSARESNATLPELLTTSRRYRWCELQLRTIDSSRWPSNLDLEVQVLRIGDLAIVAIPGEVFVEIGLAIKAASTVPFTFVCGYSNGVRFYIPTERAFDQGGYEVNSYRNYHFPCGPTPEWSGRLEATASDIIGSVYP